MDRHRLALDAARADTLGGAAAAARWSYDEEHGGGPAPDPFDEIEDELNVPDTSDDEADDIGACHDGCAVQAAVLGASAVATYIAALAFCTAAGPFWPVCAAAATASYLLALSELDAVVDRCVAKCNG